MLSTTTTRLSGKEAKGRHCHDFLRYTEEFSRMNEQSSLHGANLPGQSKPLPLQLKLHIRQPIVIAALVAGAGFALLSTTRASAPVVEKREAQASLDTITSKLPAVGFTVPQELTADPNLHTAVAGPKELVPVTRFVAAPTANVPGPEMKTLELPQELSLSPAPETRADPQPLPPKIKGAFPRGLHPVIKHSMVEASRYLPDGWQLEFMNALRDAPGVWNGPHGKRDKTGGALAVDVWLVNPKGERLCNFKCTQNFEPYQTFMQMVKYIQDRDFPAYRNQGRWGGYFGGSYANDEMHYDLEPSAWTAAGNWEKGLFPQYAYFGKKSDVGKGMGQIASYQMPPTGTVLASLETPVRGTAPVAVAAKSTPPVGDKLAALTPDVVAPVAPPKPAAVPAPVPAVRATPVATATIPTPAAQAVPQRRVTAMQQVAQQWKLRAPRAQVRQRWESEEDAEARAEARAQMRYAQAQRYGRRGARQMSDYGDD
jgi:hypothetical protein